MQDARALLDSLMGPSRDKSGEEQSKTDGWKERNVCKRYLVGFCPNDANDNWFHNTRRNAELCYKIHSDRLREDFLAHPDREKYEPEYEREFLGYLDGLISEADAWVSRERSNCAGGGKVTKMPSSAKQNLINLQERADQLIKEAEDLADKGNIAASQLSMESHKKVQEDIQALKEKHTYISEGEKVCEICGVRGSVDDVASNTANFEAHYNGILHQSYAKIREKAKELRARCSLRSELKAEMKSAEKKDRDKDRKKDDKEKDSKDRKDDNGSKKKDESKDRDSKRKDDRSRRSHSRSRRDKKSRSRSRRRRDRSRSRRDRRR